MDSYYYSIHIDFIECLNNVSLVLHFILVIIIITITVCTRGRCKTRNVEWNGTAEWNKEWNAKRLKPAKIRDQREVLLRKAEWIAAAIGALY